MRVFLTVHCTVSDIQVTVKTISHLSYLNMNLDITKAKYLFIIRNILLPLCGFIASATFYLQQCKLSLTDKFVNVEYQHLQTDVVYQHLQIEYCSNNFTSQNNEIHVSQLLIMNYVSTMYNQNYTPIEAQ